MTETVKCGLYYVQTTATMPFRGCGWYMQPTVEYGLQQGCILLEDIELQLVPTHTLPPNFFQTHIDWIESFFDDAAMQKLAVNAFIGMLVTKQRNIQRTVLTRDKSELGEMLLTNNTGCELYTDVAYESEHETLYKGVYTYKAASNGSTYPIYKQVLELEAIELHRLQQIVMISGGTPLFVKTDAVQYELEASNKRSKTSNLAHHLVCDDGHFLATEALPLGWTRYCDSEQRIVYHNVHTGVRQLQKPAFPPLRTIDLRGGAHTLFRTVGEAQLVYCLLARCR